MVMQRQLLSVEEYLALPEEKPYLEYVNGRVCAKPMPNWKHMEIARWLFLALVAYEETYGGRTLWEGRTAFGDPTDVRFLLPDLSFYRAGLDYRKTPMPPPTLAVEVVSPEQPLAELREKCRFYLAHGVEAAWLVDPERRTAETFEAGGATGPLAADGALTAAALPGLRVALIELFAALDRVD